MDTAALFQCVLRDDDDHAFQRLFRYMYRPLCRFCSRIVAVPEVAEELVSDVLMSIWKNRKLIQVASPQAYLFTAVRNRGYDYRRQQRHMIRCSLDAVSTFATTDDDGETQVLQRELAGHIEHAVSRLPRQCRTVFELSREEGMKYKDIASRLDISIKTVETQMGRALKMLRERLPQS